ncbi:MAG: glycogen debranching protein GlgX, partial [Polyangiaceae bacterium]
MRHEPLGPRIDHNGASFSLFSAHATHVELCIFDDDRESRIAMQRDGDEWHAFAPGARFGMPYGFRVYGAWNPNEGDRFNGSKLLIDPYARSFAGKVDYGGPVFASNLGSKGDGDAPDLQDDAPFVPKSVLVDTRFDWRGDASPKIPWRDSVIYEAHVKGFTKLHPGVAPEERGTYLGVASDAAIAHLRALGITAIELLPVHECLDEPSVARRGMHNYWGYATLGFFAPDQRFATRAGDQVVEFKEMVRRLHAAGIEVILDVVFNHTCEGDELGPSVSFRGLDNRAYYKLKSDNRREYADFTGCGNTFDTSHPYGVRLVCDSLRYWIEEMHVDGFRFDLAPALGREKGTFDPRAPLFHAMFQDPVIARAKLIAEPWDVAPGSMQLGNFPAPWREWNADFRDDVRRFWNGGIPNAGALATRLAGSSDLFAGRGPLASINFVTAHDGFTLRDLVSYSMKHNAANGENGGDGNDHNDSTNFGIEGEAPPGAAGERVKIARLRQVRNFL